MQTVEDAKETNRRLHRRLQAIEGPMQAKIERAESVAEFWANQYRGTFDRLLAAHREMKLVYVAAAKITGAPHGSFHSVMDGCRGWGDNQEHVFANVFMPSGVESIRVVDEVNRALEGKKRPSWWSRFFHSWLVCKQYGENIWATFCWFPQR